MSIKRIVLVLLLTPLFASAQGTVQSSDGSVPPDPQPADATIVADPAPVVTPADAGTAQSAPASGTQAPSGTQTPTPASTTPTAQSAPVGGASQNSGASGAPQNAATEAPVPAARTIDTQTASSTPVPVSNPWLWPVFALLAIVPFGFLIAGWLKKKPAQRDESNNRCFDIKQLMEEKFKELTDVKAMLKEKAVERSKEAMRDAVSGSAAGDLLVRAEKLEEQYHKLKKLYEECQVDIDRYRYKGVLIENSLLDKEILKQVRIIRTREEGDWKLHDIRLSKKQIDDIQRNIADTKWYFHLWEPGKDEVIVVFKDKLFTIKHSDKTTWEPAIAHGIAHGIPKEQLDFLIA